MSPSPVVEADARDLVALTATLIAVPSESHNERALADAVEERLARRAPDLRLVRVGDTVVARTELGRGRRVVLGGHLDTVPPNGNAAPHLDGETLFGLGAADMKGGVAALLRLAERAATARFDCTFVFYEGEEVADEHNGLRRVFEEEPAAISGDLAVLLEPTGGWVEAGCQGTLHLRAVFEGTRAHSARPWMGDNAIHRAADVLARVARHASDTVTVDGLDFRESLQVVRIEGGVANNVVPDRCTVVVNRRFAPCFTEDEARAQVEELLDGADRVELVSSAAGARPNLWEPLVAEFVGTLDLAVRPKLGWTDVARFAARGIPALNFGPGDPTIAHTANEHVSREALEGTYAALARFLGVAE